MKLSGIVVPTLTPMDKTGRTLNLDAVQPFVDFLLGHHVNALFINGTTGEGPLLNLEERKLLTEAFIGAVRSRVPVAVQIGAITTSESVTLARHAAEAGADALVCMTPYYFQYTDAELEHFFLEIISAAPEIHYYLYTIPSRAAHGIPAAMAERLAEQPNLLGVKDSSGDLDQLLQYLNIPAFEVLCGNDLLAIPALQAGASGTVSGPANIFPEVYAAMWKSWSAQDLQGALYWHTVINQLIYVMNRTSRFNLFKTLAEMRVTGLGALRPPLMARPESDVQSTVRTLRRVLQETRLPEEAYEWLE